jgi:hypothetical protein
LKVIVIVGVISGVIGKQFYQKIGKIEHPSNDFKFLTSSISILLICNFIFSFRVSSIKQLPLSNSWLLPPNIISSMGKFGLFLNAVISSDNANENPEKEKGND